MRRRSRRRLSLAAIAVLLVVGLLIALEDSEELPPAEPPVSQPTEPPELPPAQLPAPPPEALPAESPGSCDPSYPDFCIPPRPPDLNCPDIAGYQRPFRVIGRDPHGFDRDGDGWGCE